MKKIKKVLISENSEIFYLKEIKDFHSKYGVLKKEDIAKGGIVKTHIGKKFYVLDPIFIDFYRNLKRKAQIIYPKDIGWIIMETGINKESIVLDAGSGSGALALFLAKIAKKVISYERRKDFYEIVKENIKMLEIKNIELKLKDIKDCEEKDIDVVIYDLPEPWLYISQAAKALKKNGFLVVYLPSITQVINFVKEINKRNDFVFIKTLETFYREWVVRPEKKIVRPEHEMVGHTAFLTFCRKL